MLLTDRLPVMDHFWKCGGSLRSGKIARPPDFLWSYEDEYRLIGIPQALPGAPMQLDSDWINLPRGALAAVILGCQADQKRVERFFEVMPHNLLSKRRSAPETNIA
jgi:hypothetical protein